MSLILPKRNIIVNPLMRVWQRGFSSLTALTTGADTYLADRWRYQNSGTAASHSAQRSTDVPSLAQSGVIFNNSLLLDCTNSDSSPGSTETVNLSYFVEGYDWQQIAHRPFTVSFWIKVTAASKSFPINMGAGFGNAGTNNNYPILFPVAAHDTWQRVVIRVPAFSTSGTWNYDTSLGLQFRIYLTAGSSFLATSGVINTSSGLIAPTGLENMCDNTNIDIRLTGVQIEPGNSVTPLEIVDPVADLQRCFRYCWQINSTASVNAHFALGTVPNSGTSTIWAWAKTPVSMRVLPSVAVSALSDIGGTDTQNAASLNSLAVTANGSTLDYLYLTATQAGATWTGNRPAYLYVSNGTGRFVRFDAEY